MTIDTERKATAVSARTLFVGTEDRYEIPLYQRNYTWGEEHIQQLFRDVHEAFTANCSSTYFLGNLVVSSLPDKGRYEVIDGQQRLTTLFVIVASLVKINLVKKNDIAIDHATLSPLVYRARENASRTLRLLKSGDGLENTDGIDDVIAQAAEAVRIYFDTFDGDLKAFARYLVDNVKVVRACIPPSTDLNRYFEVMNTRGIQLSPVDIIKARLMRSIDDQTDRSVFEAIWAGCADMSRYVQMSLYPGKQDYRTAIFGPQWDEFRPRSFAHLRSLLPDAVLQSSGVHADEEGKGRSLVAALTHYAGAGENEQDEREPEGERFRYQITFESLLLHVLTLITVQDSVNKQDEKQLDDRRLVARFTEAIESVPANGTGDWVRRFGYSLLKCRYLFDRLILKRDATKGTGRVDPSDDSGGWSLMSFRRSDEDKTSGYYRDTFGRDSVGSEVDARIQRRLILLQSALRVTYTGPRTMHWITLALRTALDRYPGAVDETFDVAFAGHFFATLTDYTRTKVREAMDDPGLDAGTSVPRIVFTYTDYLLVIGSENKSLFNEYQFGYRTSIEHFLPQHPEADIDQNRVRLDDEALLHSFGNLALVTVSANSRFSNKTPRDKSKDYPDARRQSPKLELMCQLLSEPDREWRDAQIIEHANAMAALLKGDLANSGSDWG